MKLYQYEWNPDEDFLGQGAFAKVFKAINGSNQIVALKIADSATTQGGSSGGGTKYRLEDEYLKGKDLAHTHIIRYFGLEHITHPNFMGQQATHAVLIMEYADGGTLEDKFNAGDILAAGEDGKVAIMLQILKGLDYLHEQGIVHRDLKPANILFKTDKVGKPIVKLTDFGVSRDIYSKEASSTSTSPGTILYMAPEQFLKKKYGVDGKASSHTDMWALGVIFYRMLTGKLPFGYDSDNYEEVREEILNNEPNYSLVPQQYQAMLKGCLQKHAADRPGNEAAVLELLKDKQTIVPDPQATKEIKIPKPFDPGATTVVKVEPKRTEPIIPPKKKAEKNSNALWIVVGVGGLVVLLLLIMLPRIIGKGKNSGNDTTGVVIAKTDTAIKAGDGNPSLVTNIVFHKGLSNQYTYSGPVVNGVPEGIGTQVFADGFKYVGAFKNEFREGYGTGSWSTGVTYRGGWKQGYQDGYGTTNWPGGEVYRGYYKGGKRNGRGLDNYENGNKYDGDWVNDTREGYGVFTWKNGNVYTGYSSGNQFNGSGSEVAFLTGEQYKGNYTVGKRDGMFKVYSRSGSFLRNENYVNGALQ